MPNLFIRGVSEEALARLKLRAVSHGRSLQQELAAILGEAVSGDPAEALELARRLRARLRRRGRRQTDSAAMIRQDRGR